MYNTTNNTAIQFVTRSYTIMNEDIFTTKQQADQAIELQRDYIRGIDEADHAYVLFQEEGKIRAYVLQFDGDIHKKDEADVTKELLYYCDSMKPELVLIRPVA